MNRFPQFVFAFFSAFGLLSGAHAIEAVKPPMSAARKAALKVPKLIPYETVKTYVNGLAGSVNPANKTATLSGRIPNACVPILTLQSIDHPPESGPIPFGLMGSEQAVDCLKKHLADCAKIDAPNCSTFEALSKHPKYGVHFHPTIDLKQADPAKVKVVLAKTAMVMNDQSVRLEATADCCNVDGVAAALEPRPNEMPMARANLENLKIGQAATNELAAVPDPQSDLDKAGEDARKSIEERKAKRASKSGDEDDEKEDDPEAKRNAARDPTLAKVPNEKDMELATAKNMEEYYKQYYSSLMQAQQFQMSMQMQSLQFMLKQAQAAAQNSAQSAQPSLANSWMATYAPMSGLGITPATFTGVPSFASGGTFPSLVMPPLGSGVGSGIGTGQYGR